MEPPPPDSFEEPLLSPGFTCRVERPVDELLVRHPHLALLSSSTRGVLRRRVPNNVVFSLPEKNLQTAGPGLVVAVGVVAELFGAAQEVQSEPSRWSVCVG